jgi:probable F420-dependent oxidoreductase
VTLKLGVVAPLAHPLATRGYVETLADEAEQRGLESLWVGEHVVLFEKYASRYPYSPDGTMTAAPDTGLLDPFVVLSFVGARTHRLRLATGICLVAQRNPVTTAKQVADLDWLSTGRVEFGVGAGWLREESAALRVDWVGRGRRMDEHVRVMQALWTGDSSLAEDTSFDVSDCLMFPKPVQKPHPRIHVGGSSAAAIRRVARLGQGWYAFNLRPAEVQQRTKALADHLAECGRDRSDLEISVCPYEHDLTPQLIESYLQVGVDRIVARCRATTPMAIARSLDEVTTCVGRAAGE